MLTQTAPSELTHQDLQIFTKMPCFCVAPHPRRRCRPRKHARKRPRTRLTTPTASTTELAPACRYRVRLARVRLRERQGHPSAYQVRDHPGLTPACACVKRSNFPGELANSDLGVCESLWFIAPQRPDGAFVQSLFGVCSEFVRSFFGPSARAGGCNERSDSPPETPPLPPSRA